MIGPSVTSCVVDSEMFAWTVPFCGYAQISEVMTAGARMQLSTGGKSHQTFQSGGRASSLSVKCLPHRRAHGLTAGV
jgi:hypothetical protein